MRPELRARKSSPGIINMVESWVERLYASTPRHRLEALDITAPLETKASPRRRSKSPRRRTKSVELMQGNLIEYAKRQHRRSKRHEADSLLRKGTGQGGFETAEMLAARRALKHNPQVLAALREWWVATDTDKSGAIDKEEYIELLKAIYRVKVSENDEADCQKSAEADANDDFEGIDEIRHPDGKVSRAMTEDRFREAIFELADLYTDSVDAKEYETFLLDLLGQLKSKGKLG